MIRFACMHDLVNSCRGSTVLIFHFQKNSNGQQRAVPPLAVPQMSLKNVREKLGMASKKEKEKKPKKEKKLKKV